MSIAFALLKFFKVYFKLELNSTFAPHSSKDKKIKLPYGEYVRNLDPI